MDTRLTGIINEGDTRELKAWIEQIAGASDKRSTETAALREELAGMRQEIRAMQKQLDHIETILEKVE